MLTGCFTSGGMFLAQMASVLRSFYSAVPSEHPCLLFHPKLLPSISLLLPHQRMQHIRGQNWTMIGRSIFFPCCLQAKQCICKTLNLLPGTDMVLFLLSGQTNSLMWFIVTEGISRVHDVYYALSLLPHPLIHLLLLLR